MSTYYITLDDYYPTEFFNEVKSSLRNNNIEYQEFISIKPPFNWYFKIDQKPLMVNYDEISKKDQRWLVQKVKPLRANEEYLFQRRNDDTGQKAILKYTENKPLIEARKSDYACFFTVKNKEELQNISKEFPGKIYFMGKYYNNKYRICLCTNKMIKNFIDPQKILIEDTFKEPSRFEAELNYRVFRGNDMLEKHTDTPYMINGVYKDVNIKSEISGRFQL
jgi:hypothetical protein